MTDTQQLQPFDSWHTPSCTIVAELDLYGLWHGFVWAGGVVIHESHPCLAPQEAIELAASWVRPTQSSLFEEATL